MPAYAPRQGDLIALSFDPQSGHEQHGRRPALVVSKDAFNRATGLCLACPITSTNRDYPFHVALPAGQDVSGFVMVEQVKSIDYAARRARHIGKAPPAVLQEVLAILDAYIY